MSAAKIMDLLDPLDLETRALSTLVAKRELCLGPPGNKHMSGGSCVASVIFALERQAERPLIQLSAQFLAAPPCDADVSIALTLTKVGRSITHACASMTVEGNDAVRVFATLGGRDASRDHQWEQQVTARHPNACPKLAFIREDPDDLHTHLEIRQVPSRDQTATGVLQFWVKSPNQFHTAQISPFFALIADYLPEAVNGSLGKPAGAVSLDNQVRILSDQLSEWTICRVQLSGIAQGICHGRIHLFNETGHLLAVGEQSCVVLRIGAD